LQLQKQDSQTVLIGMIGPLIAVSHPLLEQYREEGLILFMLLALALPLGVVRV
jgi:hypothetical protein